MAPPTDYRKTYETAQRELADLLSEQDRIGKRILTVRKSLQTLAELCEDEGLDIEASREAAYILENTNLADDIREILKSAWPGYLRPHVVKQNLEALGRDLSKYRNAQATVHMVLKRMTESGEVEEGTIPEDGKKTYRICQPGQWAQLGAMMRRAAEIEQEAAKQLTHGFNNVTPKFDPTKKK